MKVSRKYPWSLQAKLVQALMDSLQLVTRRTSNLITMLSHKRFLAISPAFEDAVWEARRTSRRAMELDPPRSISL